MLSRLIYKRVQLAILLVLGGPFFYLFVPADEKAYLPEEEVLEKV